MLLYLSGILYNARRGEPSLAILCKEDTERTNYQDPGEEPIEVPDYYICKLKWDLTPALGRDSYQLYLTRAGFNFFGGQMQAEWNTLELVYNNEQKRCIWVGKHANNYNAHQRTWEDFLVQAKKHFDTVEKKYNNMRRKYEELQLFNI